jgi:hypothetical protein
MNPRQFKGCRDIPPPKECTKIQWQNINLPYCCVFIRFVFSCHANKKSEWYKKYLIKMSLARFSVIFSFCLFISEFIENKSLSIIMSFYFSSFKRCFSPCVWQTSCYAMCGHVKYVLFTSKTNIISTYMIKVKIVKYNCNKEIDDCDFIVWHINVMNEY